MGYFDGLVDAIFKKDTTGNTLFYPWGIFGSGYIVESKDKINQIRGFIKKLYLIFIPAVIVIQMTLGVWPNLVLVSICFLWFFYVINKITKDLPKTQEKLKFFDAYKNSAKSHKLATLIVFELFSLASVMLGVWVLISGNGWPLAFFLMGTFILCSAVIGYMIMVKIK